MLVGGCGLMKLDNGPAHLRAVQLTSQKRFVDKLRPQTCAIPPLSCLLFALFLLLKEVRICLKITCAFISLQIIYVKETIICILWKKIQSLCLRAQMKYYNNTQRNKTQIGPTIPPDYELWISLRVNMFVAFCFFPLVSVHIGILCCYGRVPGMDQQTVFTKLSVQSMRQHWNYYRIISATLCLSCSFSTAFTELSGVTGKKIFFTAEP